MILEFLDVSLWVFVIGLIVGELYLLYVRKQGLWVRLAYFALALAVSLAGWYLIQPPTLAQTLQPVKYTGFLLFVLAIPLAVFAVGLQLIARLKATMLQQLLLTVGALAIALVWPLSALYLHCAVGLGCF
jgi:hypothetical protein